MFLVELLILILFYSFADVWRPCIPSWERQFTSKIGNVKWDEFVEAKRWIHLYQKILDWKDSAAEEAFIAAKRRFWDHYNGYESEIGLPDPDMYIDEIDWSSEPDENQEDEKMGSISEAETEDQDFQNSGVVDAPSVRYEDIKPTGWDVEDFPDTADLLTGLIVGDDGSEDDNVLRDSTNIARELPALRKFHRLGY